MNVDPKDPSAIVTYKFDWSKRLGIDPITSHAITAEGVVSDAGAVDGQIVSVLLSGGTAGTWSHVTCHVETLAGHSEDYTMPVWITEL